MVRIHTSVVAKLCLKLRVPHKTMHAHAPLFLCAFLMGKCMVVMIYTHELMYDGICTRMNICVLI